MQTITSVGKKILDTMPLPIAQAWKTVVRAQNASEQVRQCWALLDVYLRYTSGILVAAYLRGEPDETVEQCLKDMEKPSLGHYCALIRAILKPIHGTDHFFSHVADWHFTSKGKPTEEVRLLHDLVTERNQDSHGPKPTEAALEEKSRVLKFRFQALLRSSNWLIGYTLFRVSEINTRSRGRQNGLIHRYHGDTMTPIPAREKWCCTSHGGVAFLQEEAMYLSHPEGNFFLEVTPFLWVDLAQKQEPIFLWVSTPKGKRIESRCDALEDKQDMLPMIEENRYAWSDWLAHRTELDPIFQNTEVARFIASEFKEIGQLLDKRFRIEARLGEGGMATVYHAVDTYMDKAIALKVLHLEQADTTVKERMKLEAKMMKRLDHPNILKISELIDLSDNRLALSMPMMSGTLKDLLTHQQVTEELVQVWAGQLISALQYLHSQESPIIHRDIKPSNVLYNDAGEVFLADFGIAFQNSGDVRLTRTAEQLGSLPYMAKELQLGEEATPATDLYALGVTLYELLMGDLPSDTLSLDLNNGFHQFVANLLDSNPEVRLHAQWGVVAKVEEVETETAPSVESESKWSNFSKRLFSQFKRSLGEVVTTLEASEATDPINLSEERKTLLVEHLVQQVLEQHGVDVSPHVMCMNRLSDAINTIGTSIQHGQNIQIDLPHFIYGPQGDVHFQYTMTFEILQDFFIEPEVDVEITPDDIKSILIDWVVSNVQTKHEVDLRQHSMVMTRIQDTIHTLVDSDERVKKYTVDLPHLFYGSAGAIHFKEEIALQAVKAKFVEAQPEIDLSADEQKEVLVSWILKTFESQHGIDLSREAMCMTRINGEVTQHLEEIQQGQSIHLELPYLYYSSAGAFNFQEHLSASDLRKLFAEYHEQKNTFDVEAALEKVNHLYFECRFDELLTELEDPNLQETSRGKALLGKMLIHGYGSCERDVSKGHELLLESVADNDARHQFWLGELLGDGTGGFEVNTTESLQWYRRSARQNYLPALVAVFDDDAVAEQDRNGFEQQIKSIMKSMDMSNLPIDLDYRYYVADALNDGTCVEANKDLAQKIFLSLAEMGYDMAQDSLGDILTMQDAHDQAFNWYMKAAVQGLDVAQWNVGHCYKLAIGTEEDATQAFQWYMKAAEQGYDLAQTEVGACFRYGYGVDENKPQAFEWYMKAAQQGDSAGQYTIGLFYEDGFGVLQDFSQAFQYQKLAADQGHADALCKVAQSYQSGLGVEYDEKKAFEYYQRAVEAGSGQACLKLASCYIEEIGVEKDMKAAFELYVTAAKEYRLTEAFFSLAQCFQYGSGIEADEDLARHWYQKGAQEGDEDCISALEVLNQPKQPTIIRRDRKWIKDHCQALRQEGTIQMDCLFCDDTVSVNKYLNHYDKQHKGESLVEFELDGETYYGDEDLDVEVLKQAYTEDPDVQFQIGQMFHLGLGVSQNPEMAFKWYSLSANQDNALGQWGLGRCYENGLGVEVDLAESFQWFQRSSRQGDLDAMLSLGRFYQYGYGVRPNEQKAFQLYKKAAEKGNVRAVVYMADCYQNGTGVLENQQKAFQLYQKAGDQGDAFGQWNLGVAYEFGLGTKKNTHQAFQWYKKSAEQGYSLGQCALGECFENGTGCNENPMRAFEWYQRAAFNGDAKGQYNLGRCHNLGIGTDENESEAFYWFCEAAKQDYAAASYQIGMCYEEGWGVEVDLMKAMRWYLIGQDDGLDVEEDIERLKSMKPRGFFNSLFDL